MKRIVRDLKRRVFLMESNPYSKGRRMRWEYIGAGLGIMALERRTLK